MSYEKQSVTSSATITVAEERPALLGRSIALMKPITWFAAMWAFFCGAVASGQLNVNLGDLIRLAMGLFMAGPMLVGLSQVINDYFDREVDAVNEPDRLIPSGLVSMWQILVTVFALLALGYGIALFLGRGIAALVSIGLLLALFYSAPPIRAKRNGWIGNTFVAIAYEGLAWTAGHLAFGPLTTPSLILAAFYSFGTHGIMSINDYKGIEGDRENGIRTIPVQLGPVGAAWLIVITMNVAQGAIIAAFLIWGNALAAFAIAVFILIQLPLQWHFIQDPLENYLKFSAIGVAVFVWGMLAAAIGVRAL